MKKILFIIAPLAFILFGCQTFDKSRMLKTPLNYHFQTFKDSVETGYQIAVDDEIQITMYSNDGYNLIRLSEGNNNNQSSSRSGLNNNSFKVRSDSTIKVPVIGKLNVVGLTLNQLENKFEQILAAHVRNPFVIAKIENRRVFLFRGGNTSTVVQLQNQNTTLFEVLAASGGIPQGSNASRIKLIRGDLKNPEIYLIDLSTIEGMQAANLEMKAGDIIYIDPYINWLGRISTDIGSIMGFVSSILLVYTLSTNSN